MNKADLVKKLNNDVKKLENKIEHRKLYNIRNYIMKALIKSGIAVDYIFPFIIIALILTSKAAAEGNLPFHIDEMVDNPRIETIDTSNGIHIEHITYDFNYDKEIIEHSTGWIKNEKNLYERTVTSYRLCDEINLANTKKILSMTKEEIEKILVVTNVKTIFKSTLTTEDEMYDEDALIIINHTKSKDDTIMRKESTGENVAYSILYIISCLGYGYSLKNIKQFLEQIFVKTYFNDFLREHELLFRPINKAELETIKKLLKIRKENLSLISETKTNNTYSYKLRKL